MQTPTGFAEGVRVGRSAAVVVFIVGLAYGAAARVEGWGVAAPIVSSAATFSGSAQFTLLEGLGSGGVVAAVVAAILINARYVVMSLALNGSLSGGRARRCVQAQALCDASFVLAQRGSGRFDLAVLAGASMPQWVAWVSGTALGASVVGGAEWFTSVGGDVAFPAFFMLLLTAELRRGRSVAFVVLASATLTAGLLLLVTPGAALLLCSSVALVGLRGARPGGAVDT